jgi:hypothetical protein
MIEPDYCNRTKDLARELAAEGADTRDIVLAFVQGAIAVAERDPDYLVKRVDILNHLFVARDALTDLREKELAGRRKPAKKK